LNEEHFQNIWDLLKNAIDKIHSNEASNLSFEELYRSVSRHTLHLVLLALGIFFGIGFTMGLVGWTSRKWLSLVVPGSVVHRTWDFLDLPPSYVSTSWCCTVVVRILGGHESDWKSELARFSE